MVVTELRTFIFKKKIVWFSDAPFDSKDCDAIYFYACPNNISAPGFIKSESPTIIIDLQKGYEELWKSMGKSTRRNIKKADKQGIIIEQNKNYEEFYEMYQKFTERKGFKAFLFDIESMKKLGTLFTAKFDGKILSGILTVQDTQNIRALLGGSIRFQANEQLRPIVSLANKFIIWKIIEYAKRENYQFFDLGGYFGGNNEKDPRSTIDFFKKQFGGTIVTYYNYVKYYSFLYSLIKKIQGQN